MLRDKRDGEEDRALGAYRGAKAQPSLVSASKELLAKYSKAKSITLGNGIPCCDMESGAQLPLKACRLAGNAFNSIRPHLKCSSTESKISLMRETN